MRRLLFIVSLLLLQVVVFGQDFKGSWMGILDVQGNKLRVVFNITAATSGYTVTMDSPDQGAKGISTSAKIEGRNIDLSVEMAGISYSGILIKDGEINGTFKQGGFSAMLILKRVANKDIKANVRIQDPQKPFQYISEDVKFENRDAGITLAGTLTLPANGDNFPAVILISGSGGQNRDEEIMNHRPFLVLSDFLTRNGVAVLRFDDRGVGESEGSQKGATTYDFATDVEAALAYLKSRQEINPKSIGLVGHSEGGLIAPIVAVDNKDDINFIVMMAGPGVRGDSLLILQNHYISQASGVSAAVVEASLKLNREAYKIIIENNDDNVIVEKIKILLDKELHKIIGMDSSNPQYQKVYNKLIGDLSNPWIKSFVRLDPSVALEKIGCAVLAINGTKDLQVSYKENLSAIEKALITGGNKKFTIKEFEGLNHLFQRCNTGLMNEYLTIEETIFPEVMEFILQWIVNKSE